ncbi:MAG: four-carbon acid sugar kinase family protein, partial [Halobacteriaceae archaeon]
MVIGLIIADDLTGAMDTGHQFAARGYRTTLNTHLADQGPDTEVRIIDTDSRTTSPETAYKTVFSVMQDTSAEIIYKKIDSTLRGNVATEAAAVLDNQNPEFAVVAPAFPAHNRRTIGGYHLVD